MKDRPISAMWDEIAKENPIYHLEDMASWFDRVEIKILEYWFYFFVEEDQIFPLQTQSYSKEDYYLLISSVIRLGEEKNMPLHHKLSSVMEKLLFEWSVYNLTFFVSIFELIEQLNLSSKVIVDFIVEKITNNTEYYYEQCYHDQNLLRFLLNILGNLPLNDKVINLCKGLIVGKYPLIALTCFDIITKNDPADGFEYYVYVEKNINVFKRDSVNRSYDRWKIRCSRNNIDFTRFIKVKKIPKKFDKNLIEDIIKNSEKLTGSAFRDKIYIFDKNNNLVKSYDEKDNNDIPEFTKNVLLNYMKDRNKKLSKKGHNVLLRT